MFFSSIFRTDEVCFLIDDKFVYFSVPFPVRVLVLYLGNLNSLIISLLDKVDSMSSLVSINEHGFFSETIKDTS